MADGKYILSDEIIEVDYDLVKERKKGVHKCRRIVKKTDDGKGNAAFITNDFDLPAETVCELYRRCWSWKRYKKKKQNFPLK